MAKFIGKAALAAGVAMVWAATPATAQQAAEAGPSRAGDLELTCPALGVEMAKAAQLLAQAPAAPSASIPAPATRGAMSSIADTAAAIGTQRLEDVGRAYQQAQNAQQLANLQALAARGGVNRGAATAAIGSVAALQQVAAAGGNVGDAARSVAADTVANQLAARIPGGRLVGGLVGGMFKKKPKPAAVEAAPAEAAVGGGARERLAFLGAIMQAKGCK